MIKPAATPAGIFRSLSDEVVIGTYWNDFEIINRRLEILNEKFRRNPGLIPQCQKHIDAVQKLLQQASIFNKLDLDLLGSKLINLEDVLIPQLPERNTYSSNTAAGMLIPVLSGRSSAASTRSGAAESGGRQIAAKGREDYPSFTGAAVQRK